MSEVIVLFDGYSMNSGKDQMTANCSCTLIKGSNNIIVDTMTPWDTQKIISALEKHNTSPKDINYVVSTHGHSDHVGNNNLFLDAKHIVGFNISFKDVYYLHAFDEGVEYVIDDNVRVLPTPGHTLSDVTVLVKTTGGKNVAICGDLFERFEDIEHPNVWQDAGTEDPILQKKNRSKVADIVDTIVPGHGPAFRVTDKIRESLRNQISV